ncbi:MAG: lysoplasmalogenase, partial [Desulfobacterales bacterium]
MKNPAATIERDPPEADKSSLRFDTLRGALAVSIQQYGSPCDPGIADFTRDKNMLTALLTFLGAVSATLHIWAEYNGPQFQIYLFKPLTMIFILLIALEKANEMRRFYGYAIVAGLLFSLAGDIFLMLPSDQFISGLISFLVAHLFYIAAFAINKPFQLSIRSILPYAIYGILIFILLLPHLGDMKFPVLAYIVVILVMGWQSWE